MHECKNAKGRNAKGRNAQCRNTPHDCISSPSFLHSCIFAFLHVHVNVSRVESAPPVELVQLLERFELLTGFAELAFGRQPLIVGEVARGLGYERVHVDGWRATPAAGGA